MSGTIAEVSGVVAAPVEEVAALLLDVRPGAAGPGNAEVLAGLGASYTVTGGPDRFTAAGPSRVTVEVDRAARTVAVQGGWWYRGEYALTAVPGGTRVSHRVRNVASRARWAVPLANRFFAGFEAATRAAFAALLTRVGDRLSAPTRLDP
ncbi:hypothetical protein [Bailinhaonella thermotolerans]|uniref:hypothetical protein n=1 Tax=Bailinhaonella thermotolerans TaxID=1070861 RepID=UPI00192A2D2D|nr:hypothetical protein [Bailinhaonella thermotolerans]